jgi:hypothetical protein
MKMPEKVENRMEKEDMIKSDIVYWGICKDLG